MRAQIDSYLDNIYLPIDTLDGMNGGDPYRYAMAHPCYGETKAALEDILADVDYVKSNLAVAKAAVDSLGAASTARQGALNGSSKDAPSVRGTQGQGSGAPSKRNGNADSDITGVRQDETKQK